MATRPTKTKKDDIEGADLHQDLKNQPGDAGDPDHTRPDSEGAPDEALAKTIEGSDADTQIAEQLKNQASQDG